MCFTLSKDSIKKIAKEDIICYKLVYYNHDFECKAYYTYFFYALNKLYTLRNTILSKMHQSYASGKSPFLYRFFNKLYIRDSQYIESGFHSYRNSPNTCHHRIVECIIPMWSEYYENETEYVSNKIIIKKYL